MDKGFKDKKIRYKYSFSTFLVGSIIIILVLFAISVIIIGSYAFKYSFTAEYNDSVLRISKSAAKEVDGDQIEDYLQLSQEQIDRVSEEMVEDSELSVIANYTPISYVTTENTLTQLCNDMGMIVIYVIVPTNDYDNFISVFNCLNDNTKFSKWEIGHVSQTTNEEYKTDYRAIMEGKSSGETVLRISELGEGDPHITALTPITDSNGDVKAIMCVQRGLDDLSSTRKSFTIGVGALAVILIELAIVMSTIYLKIQLFNPMKIIAGEADRFAKEKTREEDSILSKDLCNVKEVNQLAHYIDKMEVDTINYIEDITQFTGARERLSAELELASGIQNGMLPSVAEMSEPKEGYSIYASMTPARAVGGDFFDFYMIDDTHLVILIADVSDKGVGAAFFMAISKTLIKARAGMGGSAAEIISYVDKMIAEKNTEGMFVTVWMAIIDLSTGHVNICNSGHDYPAIMTGSGDYVIEKKTPHGPPIGFIPGAQFVEYDIDIEPGDRIFLYTDGLNEAKRSDGERFGLDRMLTVLNSHKGDSNEKTIAAMKDAVALFVGPEDQFDDMTMLSFTYEKKI